MKKTVLAEQHKLQIGGTFSLLSLIFVSTTTNCHILPPFILSSKVPFLLWDGITRNFQLSENIIFFSLRSNALASAADWTKRNYTYV